jgi:hypothetical protein
MLLDFPSVWHNPAMQTAQTGPDLVKAEKVALTSHALAFMISTTVASVSTRSKEARLKSPQSGEWIFFVEEED